MLKLGNYITGKWIEGDGEGQQLYNAVNGELIASATTKGLDFGSILQYGRTVGSPALRKMTFHERGRMLRALRSVDGEQPSASLSQSLVQSEVVVNGATE